MTAIVGNDCVKYLNENDRENVKYDLLGISFNEKKNAHTIMYEGLSKESRIRGIAIFVFENGKPMVTYNRVMCVAPLPVIKS